jgi:hypothetical protein
VPNSAYPGEAVASEFGKLRNVGGGASREARRKHRARLNCCAAENFSQPLAALDGDNYSELLRIIRSA